MKVASISPLLVLFAANAFTGSTALQNPNERVLIDAIGSPKATEWGVDENSSSLYTVEDEKRSDEGKSRVYKVLETPNSGAKKQEAPFNFAKSLTPENAKLKKGTGDGFIADVVAPLFGGERSSKPSVARSSRATSGSPQCIEQSNGLLFCAVEDFPYDGFVTGFLDCPSWATSVYDCPRCGILEGVDDDDLSCSSCSVCSSNVSFDCSNLVNGSCSKANCAGDCTGGTPPPSPTPPPSTSGGSSSGGVVCGEDDNGNVACVLPDYPADDWTTVFTGCPKSTDNALQCGSCTIVPPDDSPTEIDLGNDQQCNSCTVCSDRAAFDCSNLADGDCPLYDCGGTCSAASGSSNPTTSTTNGGSTNGGSTNGGNTNGGSTNGGGPSGGSVPQFEASPASSAVGYHGLGIMGLLSTASLLVSAL